MSLFSWRISIAWLTERRTHDQWIMDLSLEGSNILACTLITSVQKIRHRCKFSEAWVVGFKGTSPVKVSGITIRGILRNTIFIEALANHENTMEFFSTRQQQQYTATNKDLIVKMFWLKFKKYILSWIF